MQYVALIDKRHDSDYGVSFPDFPGAVTAGTGDGRNRAKERGVRFGRPRKLTPHPRQEALARLEAGETQADVARTYNVDATTIGRLPPSPFERVRTVWRSRRT